MLTSKQRAALRGKANGLDTLFQVGKDGITENLVKQTDTALAARELIKLRALETSPTGPRAAAEELAGATAAEVVQVIGTKFVLFRQKKKDSAFDLAALK